MFFKRFYCLFFFSLCLLAALMLQAMRSTAEGALGVQNGVPLMQAASALSASDKAFQAADASTDAVAGRASTGDILSFPN